MKRFLAELSTAQIAAANSKIQAGIGYLDVRHTIRNLVSCFHWHLRSSPSEFLHLGTISGISGGSRRRYPA